MVIGDMMRRGWRSASYTSASTDPDFWFTISSSIFPGPFVHRLAVGLHRDFALHLDWFDCRDSDLVTKVRPDLSFDCGVGLQDYPEQLCLLLPCIPSVPFQDLQE